MVSVLIVICYLHCYFYIKIFIDVLCVVKKWNNSHVTGLIAVVEEFQARIGEEMDFRLEAEFAQEIRDNFRASREVLIPEVVHELTRQRVMVMDFIVGTRIDRGLDELEARTRRLLAAHGLDPTPPVGSPPRG